MRPRKRLVAVIGQRVDAAEGGQLPEPEVPLLLAGAQEEVAAGDLLVEDGHGAGDDLDAHVVLVDLASQLELLEVERVVQIDDQHLVALRQPGLAVHDEALEHDDVGPPFELLELGRSSLASAVNRSGARSADPVVNSVTSWPAVASAPAMCQARMAGPAMRSPSESFVATTMRDIRTSASWPTVTPSTDQ